MKKLYIVMPAYNEEKMIGDVIKKIPKRLDGFEVGGILVVDDASVDATGKVAKKAGARVIKHRYNLGNGGATITGLEAAIRLGAEAVVTMDADGQHDPAEVGRLVKKLDKGYDLVIGSRMMRRTKDMPGWKKFGNKLMNFLTFLFSKKWVTDSQSGFRAISRKALERMELGGHGFELWSEMVWEARAKGLKVTEVPIKVIYSDYSKKKGQHYLNAINIFLRLLIRPGR